MYCTLADIRAVISERVLRDLTCDQNLENDFTRPSASDTDEAVIIAAIRSASEMIDAYLRGRYDVVAMREKTPTVLRDLTVNLVRQRLYERRPDGDLPEAVKRAYTATQTLLNDIRKGDLTLGVKPEGRDMPEPGQVRIKARAATLGGDGGWLERY